MKLIYFTALPLSMLLLQAGTCGNPMSGPPQYDYQRVADLTKAPYASDANAKMIPKSANPYSAKNPADIGDYYIGWTKGGKILEIPEEIPTEGEYWDTKELKLQKVDADGDLVYGDGVTTVYIGRPFSKNINPEYVNFFTLVPDENAIGGANYVGYFGDESYDVHLPKSGLFVYHGEVANTNGKGLAKLTLNADVHTVDLNITGGFGTEPGVIVNSIDIKGVEMDGAYFSGSGTSFSADVKGAKYENGHLDGTFYGVVDPDAKNPHPDEAAGFLSYDTGNLAGNLMFVVD